MAKVLTRKEYQDRTTAKKILPETGGAAAPLPEPDTKSEVEATRRLYILAHPDNDGIGPNFSDTVTLNGEAKARVCEGGVVQTLDTALKTYLVLMGYHLIDTVED